MASFLFNVDPDKIFDPEDNFEEIKENLEKAS